MNSSLTIADESFGRITVQFDRWDGDRAQYEWTVQCGNMIAAGDDLRMGSSAKLNDAKALVTLLDFLSAFAEAIEYERRTGTPSENLELFPAGLRDWADGVGSDGFSLLAASLGGEDE